jgi:outer membrane protein assembly factor BamB
MFAFDLPPLRRTATPLVLAIAVALAGAACVDVTGTSDPKAPADSIAVVWRTPYSGDSWSDAPDLATDGDRLFVLFDGGVNALDLATGERVWRTPKVDHSGSTLVSRDGRVFVAEGVARALDARTGAEIWRFAPDSSASGRGAVDDRAFYFATRHGLVHALAAATGELLWTVNVTPSTPYHTAGIRVLPHGDTVYASVVEDVSPTGHLKRGIVVALDRVTGRELWRAVNEEPGVWHSSDAAVVAGRMLLVGDLNGNRFFGLDRFTGKEVWSYKGAPGRFGPGQGIHVHEGVGYVASWDAFVYALDPETGRIHWKVGLPGSADTVTPCEDHIFVGFRGLYQLNRSTGKIEARLFLNREGFVENEWIQSRLLAHGSHVYFVGNQAVYAVSCK